MLACIACHEKESSIVVELGAAGGHGGGLARQSPHARMTAFGAKRTLPVPAFILSNWNQIFFGAFPHLSAKGQWLPATATKNTLMEEAIVRNTFIGSILAVGLAIAPVLAIGPANAAEVVGVHVGGVGLGFTVGNGHYYDRNHRRRSYTYPSDYRSYHHSQSWYRSHRNWNDENHADWYRR